MATNREKTRMLNTMRALTARGITDQAQLVDTAAQVIGGDDAALMDAQRVFDAHFKIHGGG